MNNFAMPSLKHIALMKTAINAWNKVLMCEKFNVDEHEQKHKSIKGDIRLSESIFTSFGFYFSNSEHQVEEYVRKFCIPDSLKEILLCVIKPIGLQIHEWILHNKTYFGLDVKLSNSIIWTNKGTVNVKKSARALVKDESIDIAKRYELAQLYCLETDVVTLRGKMLGNLKRSFFESNFPSQFAQNEVVAFWSRRSHRNHNFSLQQDLFMEAASVDNIVAAWYFWNKLTPLEKEQSFVRFLTWKRPQKNDPFLRIYQGYIGYLRPCAHRYNILRFLISQESEEKKLEVFELVGVNRILEVLLCFLQWPFQSTFMETANRMWMFVTDRVYFALLDRILGKVINGYTDYDYLALFRELWKKSDIDRRRYVINLCVREERLVSYLFTVGDLETVSLFLKDATVEEKENFFVQDGILMCRKLYFKNEITLLESFICECIASREKMTKFKNKCKRWGEMFYEILEALIQKWDKKRSMEESNCTSSKKICSSSDE